MWLLITKKIMEADIMKVTFLPMTRLGKYSLGLEISFFLLLGIGVFVANIQGPIAD